MNVSAASRSLRQVLAEGLEGPWKRYTSKGGMGRWTTVGIFKDQPSLDGRVVLEVFSHRDFPEMIIRVYTEEPLNVRFHCRAMTVGEMNDGIREAAREFEEIPGRSPQSSSLLAKILEHMFPAAWNPVPPPLDMVPPEAASEQE